MITAQYVQHIICSESKHHLQIVSQNRGEGIRQRAIRDSKAIKGELLSVDVSPPKTITYNTNVGINSKLAQDLVIQNDLLPLCVLSDSFLSDRQC